MNAYKKQRRLELEKIELGLKSTNHNELNSFKATQEAELKPAKQELSMVKKRLTEQNKLVEDYKQASHNASVLRREYQHLENKLEVVQNEEFLLMKEQNRAQEYLETIINTTPDESIYSNIDEDKLKNDLITKKDKLANLEYRIDIMNRKKMKTQIAKQTKIDILDVKNMFDSKSPLLKSIHFNSL